MKEHPKLDVSQQNRLRGATCSLTEATLESEAIEASDDRRARRLSRLLERESSTFVGVLVEAAERRTPVTVDVQGNSERSGRITAVGSDAIIMLDGTKGERSLVRSSAVRGIRTAGTSTNLTGDRPGDLSASFHGLLEELGALNEFVTITCTDGSTFAGHLNWVGQDVAQLGVGARDSTSHAYVSTNSIAIVTTR